MPQSVKEVKHFIETLSNLKEQMMSAGFNATFPEMMVATNKEFEGDGQSDAIKQLKSFREFANMKRSVLNRTRVALVSHKILFNMMQRGTVYPVASHLPYNGHYLYELIYLGEPAIRAYNSMQVLLSKRNNDVEESYSVTVNAAGKKTTFKVFARAGLEEKVKRDLGPEAEIVSIRKTEVSPPLVKQQSARIAISAAYAILAARNVYAHTPEPKNSEVHSEYADTLAKYKLGADTRLDLMEGHEELKDRLYSKGLLTEDSGGLKLNYNVLASISKRRSFYNNSTMKEVESRFAFDVFHYLVTEPKRVRSSLSLYPGVSTDINPVQFDFISKVDVNDPLKVIEDKFKFESVGPNLPGKVLGAAVVHMAGKSAEWCSEKFTVSATEVRNAVNQLSSYRKTSDQAKKFLELMKG
jgi:hypothetical protein